jgi:hypothetical protein
MVLRAQLTPIDRSLCVELALQMPCIRLKGTIFGPAPEPIIDGFPVAPAVQAYPAKERRSALA